MSFANIKSKEVKKVIVSQGPVSTLFAETLDLKAAELYDKPPILRPSGFPICSIKTMCNIAEYKKYGNVLQEGNLFSTFFTSVGTTVHEGVQDWVGKTGKVLADWQCVNIKCKKSKCVDKNCKDTSCKDHTHITKTLQVGNICKDCGSPMQYHELEVEFDIITGHVDLIMKIRKNAFWAGDFKTSSVKKLEDIKAPSVGYLYQISSYAYILKHEYGINIVGFSIFYIARDNPGIYKEFQYEFDDEAEAKAKKIIDGEIRKYKAAEMAYKTGDIMHAVDVKPCKNLTHFDRIYGEKSECRFKDVCFGSKAKLKKEISDRLSHVTNRAKVKYETGKK